VDEEDLRADAMHRHAKEPEFEEEEVVTERVPEPKAPRPFAAPRSGHLEPLKENGHGNGHKAAVKARGPAATAEEKIKLARLKGYEGDPCSECGQLTLVRSGACCKCDTCGATSGCS
jgi:ribonucleoside-diphosphate reductase alpha chain